MKVNQFIPPTISQIANIEYPTTETHIEQPQFQEPVQESYNFSPQDDTGDDSFSPVDISINQKLILPTVQPDGNGGGFFPNIPKKLSY